MRPVVADTVVADTVVADLKSATPESGTVVADTVIADTVVADLKSATPESGISNPLQQHVFPSRGFQIPSNSMCSRVGDFKSPPTAIPFNSKHK